MTRTQHQIHLSNISKAMRKFYEIADMSFEDAVEIIEGIEDDLLAVYPGYRDQEDDYRLGIDTYGYEDDAAILLTLHYLSDRWGAAFRIVWILGIVNESYR